MSLTSQLLSAGETQDNRGCQAPGSGENSGPIAVRVVALTWNVNKYPGVRGAPGKKSDSMTLSAAQPYLQFVLSLATMRLLSLYNTQMDITLNFTAFHSSLICPNQDNQREAGRESPESPVLR
jgi:hypothetical protein